MINRKMAENFRDDAKILHEEAQGAFRAAHYHRAVRLAQESFELSIKACLRSVGVEYPKEHEVSEALQENLNKFPQWLRLLLPKLSEASTWMAEKRGPAMYGDELRGTPASLLFSKVDAEKGLQYSVFALGAINRLLKDLFG